MNTAVDMLETLLGRIESRRRFPRKGAAAARPPLPTGPLERAIEAHVSEPPMAAVPPDTMPPLPPDLQDEEPMPLAREKTLPRSSSPPPPPPPIVEPFGAPLARAGRPSSSGAVAAQATRSPSSTGAERAAPASEFKAVSVSPPSQSVVTVLGGPISEATPTFGILLARTLALRPRA